MPEQLPQSGRRSLRDIARERRNRENEQPAAAIYDDARDALAALRAIRNRDQDFTWIDDRDDAVARTLNGTRRAIKPNGRLTSKRVVDIVFGETGLRAFVGDFDTNEEVA